MDRTNPLGLPVIQTVQVVDGSPPAPPDPWVAALPSALGTPRLLRPPDGLRVNTDRLRHLLDLKLRQHDLCARLEGYALVEILALPDGSDAALVEWVFDRYRLTGHGGSGEEWKVSRALLPVTPREARAIVRMWESAMTPAIAEAWAAEATDARESEMRAVLARNQLDVPDVRARRAVTMRNAQLDPASVAAARSQLLERLGYGTADIAALVRKLND